MVPPPSNRQSRRLERDQAAVELDWPDCRSGGQVRHHQRPRRSFAADRPGPRPAWWAQPATSSRRRASSTTRSCAACARGGLRIPVVLRP